jgi:hypothetical protein
MLKINLIKKIILIYFQANNILKNNFYYYFKHSLMNFMKINIYDYENK